MKTITNFSIIASAFLALTSTSALAGENLIQNGSFETYTVLKEKSNWKRVQLESWNEITKVRSNGLNATEGSNKIVLDSDKTLNSITQIVSTIKDEIYTLSVDAYANRKNLATADFEMLVDGKVIATFTPTKNWKDYSKTFVGTGTQQSIGFREINAQNNNKGVFLDNVRLTSQNTPIELAHKYGVATQGTEAGYRWYQPASNAIDGDVSTWNHTDGGKQNQNWLQIEFPSSIIFDEIVIKSGNGAVHNYRVNGAKVYLRDKPYSNGESLDESSAIATLKGVAEQTIKLPADRKASYLLIKGVNSANNSNHLHLSEVEVYGKAPQAPAFTTNFDTFLIASSTSSSEILTTVGATDYQGDNLTYSIVGDAPFSINQNGEITLNGTLSSPSYTFDVEVSDGENSVRESLTINVTSPNAIEELLASGDITKTLVTREELIQAALDELPSSTIDKKTEIEDTLQHLRDQDYDLNWKKCIGDMCLGVKSFDKTQKLWTFNNAVIALKKHIDKLDTDRVSIFDETGYRFEKLLVLIADKIRQNIHYPMDKATTEDNTFLSALFADHVVYNYRKISPKQSDLGNFSRNDFSHITPVTRQVKMNSKVSFKATGAYALPGKTVKITRNDSSDLDVFVFINTLKPGSTREYGTNSYIRPKNLRTPSMKVDAGQTIEITSPYGGPIQLAFSKNDLPVDVTFENVGEHAFWSSSADDVSFEKKLNAGDFDWAEIATSGFEVHSTLEKMRTSVSQWGTAKALAEATQQYTSNYPHLVAGYKGKGIDEVAEIHDFATSRGLSVHRLDNMKHMNADRSSCGAGCGGNPYDANWAFSVTGHGDLHELGHGIEDRRMLLSREYFDTMHTLTNLYSYYSRSRYNKIHEGTEKQLECQQLPFKELFEKVQTSQLDANPAEYLKDNLWNTKRWYMSVQVYIQAMMHTQKMGKLENGWHLLARMHILSRELSRVKGDWENSKASIGFSTYTKSEIDHISDADWTAVSMSYAAELDFRPYLDMLGLSYSQKASDQIASFKYTAVPKQLFASTPRGYCAMDEYGDYLDKEALDIDGTTVYPY